MRSIGVATLLLGITSCVEQNGYQLQGEVETIGDAMSHCRGFITSELPQGTRIVLDHLSSRENEEHYDIFFDVSDLNQSGYAKCRVDKTGLIIYHGIRGFATKSRSFADF